MVKLVIAGQVLTVLAIFLAAFYFYRSLLVTSPNRDERTSISTDKGTTIAVYLSGPSGLGYTDVIWSTCLTIIRLAI